MHGSVDPVEALARLEALAREAQGKLREGRAATGMTALRQIEVEAQDAQRWAARPGGAEAA